MTRVYVIVEGPTEETFVSEVLAPVLWSRQVYAYPIILGRHGSGSGGNVSYARVSRDVIVQLKQDPGALCSTMFDFYGLGQGFPGTPVPPSLTNVGKVKHIEDAIKADIIEREPGLQADVRFLPYLQLHEFEALLFSDPIAFASGIYKPNLAAAIQAIRNTFATPEDIDLGNAPSKRVLQLHPGYRKPLYGNLAALAVTIGRMRQECPHFNDWVNKLETL